MAQNKSQMRAKKPFKSIFVIAILIIALVLIICAMRYVQSPEFQRGLSVFFNSETSRMWKWCPADAEKIEFLKPGFSKDFLKPSDICEVGMEAVPEVNANRELVGFLTVSSKNSTKTLEVDESLEVFRVDGLIFQSRGLTETLKRP